MSENACSYGEERLAGLLYDDGDSAEMAELRTHLATCSACRAELERLGSTRDLLAAWPNVVNVPRMVYVNERTGLRARLGRWAQDIGRPGAMALLKPAAAAAAVVLVFAAAIALLDVRVAPDGRLQVGLGGGSPADEQIVGSTGDATAEAANVPDATAAAPEEPAPISREELEEGFARVVARVEELLRARGDEERRLLMAAIDERMEEQGQAMNGQLRGVVDGALTDMQQQHENDLGLVFSAIDELGVITATELQQMNTILASLLQRAPDDKE